MKRKCLTTINCSVRTVSFIAGHQFWELIVIFIYVKDKCMDGTSMSEEGTPGKSNLSFIAFRNDLNIDFIYDHTFKMGTQFLPQ